MAEKIFGAQVNYGWGLSLNMTGKAPEVAKRIFDTYADALAYVNDVNDSAIEGLALKVVADTDESKNGVYFVSKVAAAATDDSEAVVGEMHQLAFKSDITAASSGALQDAKDYTDEAISGLDVTVTAETTHINIQIDQVDGKLSAITLSEDGLATSDDVTNLETTLRGLISGETEARGEAVEGLQTTINTVSGKADDNAEAIEVLNGDEKTDGSVAKAVADAKSELEGKIKEAKDAAIAASTVVTEGGDNPHLNITGSENAAGSKTYTISLTDVASESALTALTESFTELKGDVDAFFKDATLSEEAKDTLKELQDYITSDAAGAAKMEQAIADNKANIATVSGNVQTISGSVEAIEADYLTSEDKEELQDNIETLSGHVLDNEVVIAAALTGLNNKAHVHSNLSLLETYTQTEGDLAESVRLMHEHANKTVLDNISTEDVEKWNAAEQNAKDYADEAISGAVDTINGELETLEGKISDAEAAAKAAATTVSLVEGEAHIALSEVINEETKAISYTLASVDVASASDLSGVDDRVKAIEDDYLKEEHKTALETLISSLEEELKQNDLTIATSLNTKVDTSALTATLESYATTESVNALDSRVSDLENDVIEGVDNVKVEKTSNTTTISLEWEEF